MSKIKKRRGEGFGWIIELTDDEYINISIYNPLVGNSYIIQTEELKHSRTGLKNRHQR